MAVNLWLDTAQKDGREIPETGGRECLWDILAGKDRENILIPVLPRVRSPPDCEIPIIQN
ncbi:hypothetical protein ASZ90_011311 [hydrocarbon metagenome]|uniref:Uncharacterized protein n=1 Tax=hydrocarbon metagenome TaxID=938273 RepID=A0A0W8FDL7_9ZZZZ